MSTIISQTELEAWVKFVCAAANDPQTTAKGCAYFADNLMLEFHKRFKPANPSKSENHWYYNNEQAS